MRFFSLLSFITMVLLTGCQVLFWRDAMQWSGGTWRDSAHFIEIELQFETKLPWYPLSQNHLARNYTTKLHLHSINKDEVQSSVLGEYPGWTLSVFGIEDSVVAIRGLGDQLGANKREIIRLTPDIKQPEILPAPERTLQTVLLAPDGKWLAVFSSEATMENSGDQQWLNFYQLQPTLRTDFPTISIQNPNAASVPVATWSADSSRLFVLLPNAVIAAAPGETVTAEVSSFPRCFYPLGRQISPAGKRFLRQQDGDIKFENVSSWTPYDKIEMISDRSRIGENCGD